MFKKNTIRKIFNEVAHTYDLGAFFQHEIANRLLEHLDYISLSPQRIIDLGSGTGYVTRLLQKRYPYSQIFAVDFATQMLKHAAKYMSSEKHHPIENPCFYICADAEVGLPFLDASIDMIVSNLMLPWCDDLGKTFSEIQRVLKPGGLCLFSTLGPDTLAELRTSWSNIDEMPHVHGFLDLHDVGDKLIWAKFSDPVIQTQWLTFMYKDLNALHQDLKNTGSSNVLLNRRDTLTGKNQFKQFLTEYQTYQDDMKKFPVTFEIIDGHCWKADIVKSKKQSEISIPISAIRMHRPIK